MNLDKVTIRKIRGLIVFTILILIGLYRFQLVLSGISFILSILTPFLLGGSIAFILGIPMSFIESKLFGKFPTRQKGEKGYAIGKMARPVSLILTFLFVILILFVVSVVVIPELAHTFAELAKVLPEKWPVWIENIEAYAEGYPEVVAWLQSIEVNWDETFYEITNFFKNTGGNFLGSTISAAKSIVSAFGNFFIGLAFACYILLQKEKLSRQCRKLLFAYLPEKYAEEGLRISSLTYRTFSNFLSGQCMEAVILGSMFFIAMTILRFPYAILVGVLVAFTALIPIFGAFIGCVVGAFLILTINPMQAVWFVVLFLILQQLEGNLIYPHVVGGSVGLPSIWVLAAVTLGARLMGILGMFIFIPMVSVLYTLLRENVMKRLDEKKLHIE